MSRRDASFSTWENTSIIRFGSDITREGIELQRLVLLNMDAPQHTRMRGILSRGFTPRAIGALRPALTERARRIVTDALARLRSGWMNGIKQLPVCYR